MLIRAVIVIIKLIKIVLFARVGIGYANALLSVCLSHAK